MNTKNLNPYKAALYISIVALITFLVVSVNHIARTLQAIDSVDTKNMPYIYSVGLEFALLLLAVALAVRYIDILSVDIKTKNKKAISAENEIDRSMKADQKFFVFINFFGNFWYYVSINTENKNIDWTRFQFDGDVIQGIFNVDFFSTLGYITAALIFGAGMPLMITSVSRLIGIFAYKAEQWRENNRDIDSLADKVEKDLKGK